ncbi:MAG: alpha/beta hydrolase [Prolixibacteraceae bacterium]
MKALKILLVSLTAIVLIYFVGPRMPKPILNQNLPKIEGSVANYVSNMESKPGMQIRPGCEAKIVWACDSTRQSTEYVLLYLHGFSATRREGYPVNEDFARHFGCNAFLSRLASHGLVTENPLIDMTPGLLYESAKEALAVAHQLGKKVIIMGCSTGCTLAIQLAADFPDLVDGMILYSPNVQIKQKKAALVSGPWGLQIARMNYGGNFRVTDDDPNGEVCKFWYCKYRIESIVYLQQLLDATMKKEVFEKVKCPVFVGYYYKDEQHQDEIVEVQAAIQMMDVLGTPASARKKMAFANAGDHVMACDLTSGAVPEVRNATYAFAEEILKMKPVK